MLLAAISGESLLWVFVWVVVAGLLFWLGNWFLAYVGVPAPFDKVARVVLAIIAFVFLINAILTLAGRAFITF